MLLLWVLGGPLTYLSGLGVLGGGLKGTGSPLLPLIVLTLPMRFSKVASLQFAVPRIEVCVCSLHWCGRQCQDRGSSSISTW
jgi:hypothetical protein